MNENVIVKEYEFDNPLIHKIDTIIDKCIRNCHNKYFHTFDHICEYDINFTNITNNESVNITSSDKNMGLFELNKKLTIARQRGFIFNQINKLSIKFYSHLRYVTIKYYLKSRMPMGHRLFFKIISQNKEYVENFCNDSDNPFHYALQLWTTQLNNKNHM